MKEALLDDQATGDDLLADMLAEAVERAISIPGDVGEKFERVAAGRIAEEFFFRAQTLQAIRFRERDGRKMGEVGRRKQIELPRDGGNSAGSGAVHAHGLKGTPATLA